MVQDMGKAGCHKRSKQEVGAAHAGQQEVVIATASHDFEGVRVKLGGMRFFLEVHGCSRQKQANVDITASGKGGQTGGRMEREQDETTHSREPRQSTD